MAEIVLLPGVDRLSVERGAPRPDIADSLRRLADRADDGEIESVVLVAIGPECGIFDLISTPELNFYQMLGAIEALKPIIMERRIEDRRSVTERNPPEDGNQSDG